VAVPGGWIAIESCGSPKTGFPSSLRVSGCDKLHPGM
jgi:hypothetical protein